MVRESSDILLMDNPVVAAALRHIWRHYADPSLGVPQVVAASGTSKSSLCRLFPKHLGRSIAKQIEHRRIERVKELLRWTDAPAEPIAKACGFRDAHHLRRRFRTVEGMGPQLWRTAARRQRG